MLRNDRENNILNRTWPNNFCIADAVELEPTVFFCSADWCNFKKWRWHTQCFFFPTTIGVPFPPKKKPWFQELYLDVSENSGVSPQIIPSYGFSIIFTIHFFWGKIPILGNTHLAEKKSHLCFEVVHEGLDADPRDPMVTEQVVENEAPWHHRKTLGKAQGPC